MSTSRKLTVAVGTPFDVELGATPSTGYIWELPSPPDGVQLLGSDFRQPATAAIGDGGTQVFHLRASAAGHFELSFQLKRRWETTPIETQVIEVDAR
ncbi:protease inhibitor I42 family protein [Variovorax sp. J2P1-59]|uniref:protease inhibitor I42 family protein n=1 Tax=Variovorax flavidus TaxID=3053501 RepID=UPI0025768CDC|nr:protease inhibitor I42 family protein [Variovorax sp. J2P1-59]MDM0075641.1 protease inhibitor I42 family protein [Variovorax sp. J2P1-59]